MKRILSVLLIVALCFGLSLAATADSAMTIALSGKEKVNVGETVVITATFSGSADLGSLMLRLTYDKELLTPVAIAPEASGDARDIAVSQGVLGVYSPETGVIGLISESNIASASPLFSVAFQAVKPLPVTGTPVSVSVIEAADSECNVVTKAFCDALTVTPGVLTGVEIPPQPTVRYGDVNEDGKVNAADALLVLKAAVGKVTFSEAQNLAGDVNGDSKINASDALLVLKYSVGKINAFPAEQ